MYNIVKKENWEVVYKGFETKRKAKQFIRAKKLNKKYFEIKLRKYV